MNDLQTFIAFTLIFVPALIFWICTISYVANKIFDAMERDEQLMSDYTFDCYGNPYKIDEINDYSFYDEYGRATDKKERDEYLKRESDYRDAKFKYVEDKLNDYLNTNEATLEFQYIFGSVDSHKNKKDRWEQRLNDLRKFYGKHFDDL